MNHVIVAKFRDDYSEEQIDEMLADVKKIFDNARKIEGISDVIYHRNCTFRPNRYDISITLVMERDALTLWDSCEWHHMWKDKYGNKLESKCIFDYED